MSAGPFLDHDRPRRLLGKALITGELPPAFLFLGPHGTGKEEAALALARGLNCTGPAGAADLFASPGAEREAADEGPVLGGCGRCTACMRIGRYSHPDVVVRLPLPKPKKEREPADPTGALAYKAENPYRDPPLDGGKAGIRVDDVREVVRMLAMAPVEGEKRVVVLRDAEEMTEQAQNALLKSLEEPPEHTLFILTARRPDALLPTVLSRSRVIHFGPLAPEVIASYLASEEEIDPDRAREVAVLARGSMKRALEIVEEGVRGREDALQLLGWAAAGERREAMAWASDLVFKSAGGAFDEARAVLEELTSLTRDIAAVQAGEAGKLLNPDQQELLARIGRQAAPGAGLKALEATLRARGEVDSFLNLALIYSTLYERLAELAA
ncbi:MAG: hypothetical protein R6W82_04595 [bacterium]